MAFRAQTTEQIKRRGMSNLSNANSFFSNLSMQPIFQTTPFRSLVLQAVRFIYSLPHCFGFRPAASVVSLKRTVSSFLTSRDTSLTSIKVPSWCPNQVTMSLAPPTSGSTIPSQTTDFFHPLNFLSFAISRRRKHHQSTGTDGSPLSTATSGVRRTFSRVFATWHNSVSK